MATDGKTWPQRFKEPPQGNLALNPPTLDETLQADWAVQRGRDTVERLDQARLQQFVREYLAGAIFVSAGVSDRDIPLIFLPVGLGAFNNACQQYIEEIGVLWEYWSKALSRGFNGQPMFVSCHVMHREDWDRVRVAILREQERLQSLEV